MSVSFTQARRAGFEPATRCLEGKVQGSRRVALCRLTWRLAASMITGSRLASLAVCRCWLPVWLPDRARPAMFRRPKMRAITAHVADNLAVRDSDSIASIRHAGGRHRLGTQRATRRHQRQPWRDPSRYETGIRKPIATGRIGHPYTTAASSKPTTRCPPFRWADESAVYELVSTAYAIRLLDALRQNTTPAIRQHDGTSSSTEASSQLRQRRAVDRS
jgi:hypothetical protein